MKFLQKIKDNALLNAIIVIFDLIFIGIFINNLINNNLFSKMWTFIENNLLWLSFVFAVTITLAGSIYIKIKDNNQKRNKITELMLLKFEIESNNMKNYIVFLDKKVSDYISGTAISEDRQKLIKNNSDDYSEKTREINSEIIKLLK